MSDETEIDRSLAIFLANYGRPKQDKDYRLPMTTGVVKALSLAYLAGYKDGLERGAELAERSWNTALEAMREHYPELSGNALRDYLSRPGEPDAPEPEGIHTSAHEPTDAERDAERLTTSFDDPRCICSPFRATTNEHLPECPVVRETPQGLPSAWSDTHEK